MGPSQPYRPFWVEDAAQTFRGELFRAGGEVSAAAGTLDSLSRWIQVCCVPATSSATRQGRGHCSDGVTGGSEPPQHFWLLPLGTKSCPATNPLHLGKILSPSGGGRAGGPGGIHPKWASISFLSLWALCQAELQAVTLQTVINHKLWAVLECLPRNLLGHRKSERLLTAAESISDPNLFDMASR